MISDIGTRVLTGMKYNNTSEYKEELGCPNKGTSRLDFQLEVPALSSHNIQSN